MKKSVITIKNNYFGVKLTTSHFVLSGCIGQNLAGETNFNDLYNLGTTVNTQPEDTGPSEDPSQTGIVLGETGDEFGDAFNQATGETADHYHWRMSNADYDPNDPTTWNTGGGDGTALANPNAYVEPTIFKDKNGNEHGSQAEATALTNYTPPVED